MSIKKLFIRPFYVLVGLLFISTLANANSSVIPAEDLPLPLSEEQIEWLNKHDQIQIGAMDDWEPISFVNHNGQADGFNVAFIELLNQRLGQRLKLVSGDWPEIYQNVIDKKLDAILDITEKESRKPFFNFTKPYLNIPHVVIGRDEPPYYLDENELNGKTIALEKGFGNVRYYRKHFPEIKIVEYENTSEALGAVSSGEAEAYIGNRAVADNIIRKELLSSLKVHSRADKSGSVLAIGARKDWPELAEILQVALNSVSSQEFHAILGDVIRKQTAISGDSIKLSRAEKEWLEAHPVIRITTNPNWPPMEYADENQQYQGVSAEFLKLVEQKLGVDFVHIPIYPWTKMLQGLQTRRVDLIPMAMETPHRRNFALFTRPYVANSVGIITQNEVSFIPGIEGLQGNTVAVVNGFAIHEMLRSEYPDIQIKPYESVELALRGVTRGEAFAFIGNIATASFIIRDKGLTNLRISGETGFENRLSMAVRSDWPELASILDKTLSTISAQEKAEIYSRWVHVDVGQGIPKAWIVGGSSALAALVIIVVLFSVWNYQLNQKVKERTELLEYRAEHDDLTQISNRTSLVTQLDQRIHSSQRSKGSRFAVLFIDLDDFKKVNDTQGHAIGDKLLISVANRLKSSIRKSDFISRFGGDEFVVITDSVESLDDIETFCSHLLKVKKEPYVLDGLTIKMTMSIGVSCYPEDGETANELLRKADTAMYASKDQGRNHFNFFSEAMNEHMKRRMLLEEELMQALERDEIYLVFQPIVNLANGTASRFEVLARWNNRLHGNVPPDEFISLAEHNGVIIQLGEYILESALEASARFSKQFDERFSVSVNVSPVQLNEPEFVTMVLDLLNKHQFSAERLILEVTEGVLLNRSEQSEKALFTLAEKGVRLAMDDFGTGYSSLSYIRNYPFNILKIDREFIQDIPEDITDLGLVETVLAMANSMGIDVVAEGVETKEQADILISSGCSNAQGYYFSRPLEEGALTEWLSEQKK